MFGEYEVSVDNVFISLMVITIGIIVTSNNKKN